MSATVLKLTLRLQEGDEYRAVYSVEPTIARSEWDEPQWPLAPYTPIVSVPFDQLRSLSLDPDAYGLQLARLLFADNQLRETLEVARAYAKADEVPLRLCLDLDADDGPLHGLLWETLHDPIHGGRLASSGRLLLSRYLASRHAIPRRRRPREGLRGLIAVAAPRDLADFQLAPLDAAAEVQQAKAGLADMQLTVLAHGVGAGSATLPAILDGLSSTPDVLYLVCHGTTRNGQTTLWLEGPDGMSQRVPAAKLAEGIRNLEPRPALVVLMVCQSGGLSGDSDVLALLGPQLSAAGVTAVVAMQGNLSLETAATWLPSFFRELARDGQVDRACAIARGRIQDRPDWWVPALWLRALDGRLWDEAEEAPWTPPASWPQWADFEPPKGRQLIGRAVALASYAAQLAAQRLTIVCGSAGIGKTNLAIALARQAEDLRRVCWTTFDASDDVGTMLRRLAFFLALHGSPDFARELSATGQTAELAVRNRELFDRMLEHLCGKGFLICLDDVQFLEARAADQEARPADRADLAYIFRRLAEAATAGELALLVTSWGVPDGLHGLIESSELGGFELADTRVLLLAQGVIMDDGRIERLNRLTAGNAHELVLAANAFAAPGIDIDRLLNELEQHGPTGDLGLMLTRRVDQLLEKKPAQRSVLIALAVLEGLASRAAIEAVLAENFNAYAPLLQLERDNLIEQMGAGQEVYRLYELRRQFYYDQPTELERELMHAKAARYFEDNDDFLRAARHAADAKDHRTAARLALDNFWALVNRREAEGLSRLLARIEPKRLEKLQEVRLSLFRGRLARALGDQEAAARHLKQALLLARHQPPSVAAVAIRGEVYASLGRLRSLEADPEALRYAEEGLKVIEGADLPETRANLQIVRGAAQMGLKDYPAARAAYEAALDALLAYGLVPLRVDALLGLGDCLALLGEYAGARERMEEARDTVDYLEDKYRAISVYNDMAVLLDRMGDWPGAVASYEQASAYAKELGTPRQRSRLQFNLGLLALKRGDLPGARASFAEGRQLAQKYRLATLELYNVLGLADLMLREETLGEAPPLLADAARLDTRGEYRAERDRLTAELQRATGAVAEARTTSEQGLVAAGDDPYQKGVCLRTHGRVLAAAGELVAAEDAFAQSLALLEPVERYEAARTQMAWGVACRRDGAAGRGEPMIAAARALFDRLGARSDLEETQAE